MKVRPLFAWFDLWIGAYWDRKTRKLYILPLPCIGVVLDFSRPIQPTPGIERMERKMAVRNFQVRLDRLVQELDSYPPAEMLRAAADLLDAGLRRQWVRATAERALAKMDGDDHGGSR